MGSRRGIRPELLLLLLWLLGSRLLELLLLRRSLLELLELLLLQWGL